MYVAILPELVTQLGVRVYNSEVHTFGPAGAYVLSAMRECIQDGWTKINLAKLADELGMQRGRLRRTLRSLEDMGALTHMGQSWYRIGHHPIRASESGVSDGASHPTALSSLPKSGVPTVNFMTNGTFSYGPVKIGHSDNVRQRAREYVRTRPLFRPSFLAFLEGDTLLENSLQRRFWAQRIDKNWFWPSSELDQLILNIRGGL